MTANLTLTYGSLNLTATPYLVEFGLDVGSPQNEANPLAFLLQDGEVELSSRASNRTFSFNVLIEGATLSVLATAEAALIAETEKVLNTLTVDPGDSAPATVFDIYRGQVALVRDDNWELNRMRRYTVTVRALPFGKSTAEAVSVGLPTTGATTTVLDTAGATTGWSGLIDGVSATVTANTGPPTTVSVTASSGTSTIVLQKTFAATTTTTKLLTVDWLVSPILGWSDLTAKGDGVTLPLIGRTASPTAGYTRSYFYVAASSLAVTRFEMVPSGGSGGSPRSVYIDNVAVTNAPPTIGSSRQQIRSLKVAGSARTPGSLAVESPTVALGDSLIYVYPNTTDSIGYSPPLRQYRSLGNTVTPNAAMVSGSSEPLSGGGVVFGILANQLPAGSYVLIGRLSASSAATYTVTTSAGTYFGSTSTGTVITTCNPSLTTTMTNYALCRLTLPVTDFDPTSSASTGIIISTTGAVTYDEFWLFNTTIGALTWVDCGTGTAAAGGPARRIFIDAPSVTAPRPVIRIGHSADRTDAFYPRGALKSWQVPQFTPAGVNVLAVTPNATDAVISLHHYPRWHSNAAS